VNWRITVNELMSLDLMIEQFVLVTVRCTQSRPSLNVCEITVGLVWPVLGLGKETIRSDMVSSSMWAEVCTGGWCGVLRSISTSLSFVKMRELMVGVVIFSSDSVGGMYERFGQRDGNEVEGVRVPSVVMSPSSVKTLGGKNCKPVH
jgi:hypothetical protein